MNKIEILLKDKHPRLACTLYSLKHSCDPDYISRAMRMDSMIMRCSSFGEMNPDKNLYYIELGDRGDGFFAEHGKLLKFLYYADRFGFIPIVKYTDNYLYAEKKPVNGKTNPFEYYFEQPGGISVEEGSKSKNVFLAEHIHTKIRDLTDSKSNDYSVYERYIELLGTIEKKYIHLNIFSDRFINEGIRNLNIGSDTIGVHYRGTDYKRKLKDHPIMASIDEYQKKIDELLAKGSYKKIFIATDDFDAIKVFKRKYGEKLYFYSDVYRQSGDVSVAFSVDKRDRHHYMLGLEVLRDMHSLSACGGLVAGVSQVSLAARIHKYGEKEKYNDLIIFDKGVSLKGKDPQKYYSRYMK